MRGLRLNRKWVRVTGYIVGFTRDDVLIYSNNTFYWVDASNVFKLSKSRR